MRNGPVWHEWIAAVTAKLANAVICDRCGATISDIDGTCIAMRSERCQGYEAIERAGEGA